MSGKTGVYTPVVAEQEDAAPETLDEQAEVSVSFPLEHLPPIAREMAEAVARVARTPETLTGCCVLGIMSGSVGAGLQVKSLPGKTTGGNLFIVPSAGSGTGKSEAIRPIADPLFVREKAIVKNWEKEVLPNLLAEDELLECEIARLKKNSMKAGKVVHDRDEARNELKALKRAQAETKKGLNPPRLTCEDVTSQKLAVMLEQNQEQLLSISSDAGNIVNIILGQYSSLDRTDENIYLKAWSGDNCRVDRQGREPVSLDRPCLSAVWLVQPDKIEALLAERELTDGGLVPRLLVCHSRADHRPIDRSVADIPADTTKAWGNLVDQLITTFRMGPERVTIESAHEAQDRMDEHYHGILARLKSDLKDVESYAVRWNEQAWRISVVLHAGEHGAEAGKHPLSGETAANAIAIAEWFAAEQLRILQHGRDAARRTKWDEVLALLADKPTEGVTARAVQRAGIVNTADEAKALLAEMEAAGELFGRDEKPENGGHVTRVFTRLQKFT